MTKLDDVVVRKIIIDILQFDVQKVGNCISKLPYFKVF